MNFNTGPDHHNYKHGMSKTRTFRIWSGMLQRCTNKNNHAYERYGGRGILVCDRWTSFELFLADMGECPEGHSIDRISNDIGYEPGNCKWSSDFEQAKNKRCVKLYEFRGEQLLAREIAEKIGIKESTVRWRIKHGIRLEATLDRCVYLEHQGVKLSIKGWANKLGICSSTIVMRRKRGLPLEDVLRG